MAEGLHTQHLAWAAPSRGAMVINAGAGVAADAAVLDPAVYGATAVPVGAGGRQAAWFVSGTFGEGVLRQYRRGGAIARLSRDRYVWTGASRTRCMAEFALLKTLFERGLPVPEPLAAGYWRDALTYRAALLTRRIPAVRPLAERMADAPLQAVAQALVDMHEAGVWHADLNAYNIMIDANDRVWLLDFDRGTQGSLTDRGRQANLDRLARSLRKVGGTQGAVVAERLLGLYQTIRKR